MKYFLRLSHFYYLIFSYVSTLTLAGSINSLLRFSERHHSPVSFTFTLQSFWLIDNQTQRVEQFSRKKTTKTFQNRYQLTIGTDCVGEAGTYVSRQILKVSKLMMVHNSKVYHLVGFEVLIKVVSNNSSFILAILICSLWFAFNRQRSITSLIKIKPKKTSKN